MSYINSENENKNSDLNLKREREINQRINAARKMKSLSLNSLKVCVFVYVRYEA